VALGTVAAARIATNPLYQPVLAKAAVRETFAIPNTARKGHAMAEQTVLPDTRLTLEDSVAKLIVARSHNAPEQNIQALSSGSLLERTRQALAVPDQYLPGGALLSKTQTRTTNLFGRFTSYDPEKTTQHVTDLRNRMIERSQRSLIFDEGEGGYTQRVGSLPPLRDIANYYDNNIVAPTLQGVQAGKEKSFRKQEVRRLFRAYARELKEAGVQVVLGPVLDQPYNRSTLPAIGKDDRAPTDWTLNTIDLAVEYIQAMHANNITVTAKHFPGIGGITEDLHTTASCVSMNDRPLVQKNAEIYQRIDAMLAKAGRGIDAVMISHAGNPNDNCVPYSLSSRTYDFLREQLYDNKTTRGLGMDATLALTDEVSMASARAGLALLPEHSQALVAHCATDEGRFAALAIRAGADGVIQNGRIDPIVSCIASTARKDPVLYERIGNAYAAWEQFARGKKR